MVVAFRAMGLESDQVGAVTDHIKPPMTPDSLLSHGNCLGVNLAVCNTGISAHGMVEMVFGRRRSWV